MSNNRSSRTCSKKLRGAKAFGQYSSAAAGTTSCALEMVSAFAPIPKPAKVGISIGIGLLFGCCGSYEEYKKEDVDVRQDKELEEIRHHLKLKEADEAPLLAEIKRSTGTSKKSPRLLSQETKALSSVPRKNEATRSDDQGYQLLKMEGGDLFDDPETAALERKPSFRL